MPCCPPAALITEFLWLIGSERCHSVISHIVQNTADVRRDVNRRFLGLPDERMFQQFIVLRSLRLLLN